MVQSLYRSGSIGFPVVSNVNFASLLTQLVEPTPKLSSDQNPHGFSRLGMILRVSKCQFVKCLVAQK